ncbi:Taf13 protein [Starmerella bacillaris]|uniref:Transcription initiation factor TFIID subunit 13 n=1 Tax=Starmerella bacillaris TaxID=1247836 RepID=A0AAV5RLW3_STABA|nr:Taf13 protein [Starmerella bacillaris]
MVEESKRPTKRQRQPLFANDLKALLYAFGDVDTPYVETIGVLEDILQEYLFSICNEAARMARAAGRNKIKVDDFKFALRNDPRKLGRVEKLLVLQKEFDAARKEYDYSRLEGRQLQRMLE